MLKDKYKRLGTAVLHFFNYNKIENENGSNRVILNIFDMILAVAYAGISFSQLSSVSWLVFVINLITLSRLIAANVRNSYNIRDEYAQIYGKRPGMLLKSACDIKVMIELSVIFVMLMQFVIFGVVLEENVIRNFAMMVIAIALSENIMNVFVGLFKASMDINKMEIKS